MKLLLISLLMFLFIDSTFSQSSVKQNYDSLWYFHPFSVDLSAGVWIPTGKLCDYYNPSAQFGGGLGIMISKKMRFQLWVMPRVLNQNEPLPLKVNDSTIHGKKNLLGGSVGGWLSYTFYQGKILSSEVITGVSREDIPTVLEKSISNDTLTVAGLGLSIGINSWINTFSRLNFGLRAIYTYTTYDKSKYLASSIGGHSITFTIVYRFPRRSQDFKRWY